MKHFFCIFVLFLTYFYPLKNGWGLINSHSEVIESDESPLSTHLTDFQKFVQQKINHAKNLKPEEISLIDHPQNMNLYTFLTLMEKDAGLFTGEKGLGKQEVFEFGRARLVSCMGNLNNTPVLITALSVILNPDWILKRPAIPTSESSLWQSETVFYPLRPEDNGKQTNLYHDMVLFPIIYQLNNTNIPFQIEKEITLTACQNDNCLTKTQSYQLTVDTGKGYQTDICPAIMHELYASPKPLPATIQQTVHRNQEGFIQVNLSFPQSISDIDIQIEKPTTFTIHKKFIDKKQARIILKPDKPVSKNESIQFLILSSAGLFQFEAVPDNQPFEQDKPSIQWKQLIINGLWFFLFSPFYLLFWSLRPKQPEELVQTFAFVSFNLIIFAVLAGCLLYFGIQVQLFFSMPIILIAQTILMAFILIKPFIKQTGLSLLMLTMPYPFLYQVAPIFPDGQIISAFGITSWWAFCAFVPFWLSYRHLILFQSMEQALTPIRKLIRLPAFFMFIWMLVSSVLSITQTKNTFSETELEKLLSENKSVFVSIYEPPCITCLLNQFAGQYLYPTNTLLTQDKLIFRQINQKTSLGQAFLKKYNIQSGISFYMLYGPNQKYGLRIENHYFQPEEWFDYLKLVGGLPTVKEIEITDAPLEETFVDTLKIQELILELKQKEKK